VWPPVTRRQLLGLPLLPGDPDEVLAHDEPSECPYLPDRVAVLPLRLPLEPLTRERLERRLAQGERRQGRLVYRAECPTCQLCEAIRVPVARFRPSRTQRRVFARGQREIETTCGPVETTRERVALYNRHKLLRGLGADDTELGLDGYAALLAATCCESFELRYHVAGRLMGVAIVDRAVRSLSAVYCYYDPDCAALSPGTYSILYQIELCRREGLDYLYLGLTVDGCKAMAYKSTYLPHERRVAGRWASVER
jgi:leucyl-tRNA---protein transferase